MAIWQFDFHLVPASSVRKRFAVAPVTITMEEYATVSWWDEQEEDLLQRIKADFSVILPPTRGWDSQVDSWGQEEGDRFDVSGDQSRITEIYGRMDARNLSLPFLNSVVDIARRHDLLFITGDRHVLRPSLRELFAAIRRSASFAFVADPEEFLSRLTHDD